MRLTAAVCAGGGVGRVGQGAWGPWGRRGWRGRSRWWRPSRSSSRTRSPRRTPSAPARAATGPGSATSPSAAGEAQPRPPLTAPCALCRLQISMAHPVCCVAVELTIRARPQVGSAMPAADFRGAPRFVSRPRCSLARLRAALAAVTGRARRIRRRRRADGLRRAVCCSCVCRCVCLWDVGCGPGGAGARSSSRRAGTGRRSWPRTT